MSSLGADQGQDRAMAKGSANIGNALKRALQGAARECAEIIERDRTSSKDRFGVAFVLALRPWNYSGSQQFNRD